MPSILQTERCLRLQGSCLGIQHSIIVDLSPGCVLSTYCLYLLEKCKKRSFSLIAFSCLLVCPSVSSALLITHDRQKGTFSLFTFSQSISFRNRSCFHSEHQGFTSRSCKPFIWSHIRIMFMLLQKQNPSSTLTVFSHLQLRPSQLQGLYGIITEPLL